MQLSETGWSEPNKSGVGLTVNWLKVKNDSIDASLTLVNNYNYEVVIPEDSIKCFVDSQSSLSQRSNKRIILSPGQRTQGVYVFDFEEETRRENKIVFKAEYVFKGVQDSARVSEVATKTNSYAIGGATKVGNSVFGSAVGTSDTHTKGITYDGLTFKEGDRLPSPVVSIHVQ